MKTAVMYGAGNIGRGFIGTLFSASGYRTVFIDVSVPLVEALNRDGAYPVRLLSTDRCEEIEVCNVCAVDGTDIAAVAQAISTADIAAVSVGVRVLPKIVPHLVAGLRLRRACGGRPLDILICENLMDANQYLSQQIRACLSEEEIFWFEENVGLVETSIGRMVPRQTPEMMEGNPLRICAESYGYLPVDRAAFKGEIPQIEGMIPYQPFDFYVKRKLFLHNMGHAVCAYLGDLAGLEFVYDAIGREDVYSLVKGAMSEGAVALSREYDVPLGDLLEHVEDLLNRFTNRALKDTCQRVGGDPKRKLAPKDRLVGALRLSEKHGGVPSYISVGIAAALRRFLAESEEVEGTLGDAKTVLEEICGIPANSEQGKMILEFYDFLDDCKDFCDLRKLADKKKAQKRARVI